VPLAQTKSYAGAGPTAASFQSYGKVIKLLTVDAPLFADMIDGLAAGVFLVDANGNIVHANASARHLLAEGTVVRAAGKLLRLVSNSANAALLRAVAAASDDLEGPRMSIPIVRDGYENFVAHVLPLHSGDRIGDRLAPTAIAAVFIRRAELDVTLPVASVAQGYGLTPTEAKVLRAVVELGGVDQFAEALGMAKATVKTHLTRLFEKTGTGRQVDLVKLTLSFADPIASSPRHRPDLVS